MRVIDFQLHEPAPFHAWDDVGEDLRRRVLTDIMLQSLDDMGVDAAVLYPMEDSEWACGLAQSMPNRFAAVTVLGRTAERGGVDIGSPTLEADIAGLRGQGIVGLRCSLATPFVPDDEAAQFASGEFDRALALCEAHGVPLFMFCSGRLSALERPARLFPRLQIIADHIGLAQPPFQALAADPWAAADDLVALARFPNIAVKLCGALALSTEPWPHADLWPHLDRIFSAYGAERIAWASDIQRFRGRVAWNIRHPAGEGEYLGKHTFRDSLAFFLHTDRLSAEQKALILGGTAARLLGWPA